MPDDIWTVSVKYRLLPYVSPSFLFRPIVISFQQPCHRQDCQAETGKSATEQILTFSPELKFYKEKVWMENMVESLLRPQR